MESLPSIDYLMKTSRKRIENKHPNNWWWRTWTKVELLIIIENMRNQYIGENSRLFIQQFSLSFKNPAAGLCFLPGDWISKIMACMFSSTQAKNWELLLWAYLQQVFSQRFQWERKPSGFSENSFVQSLASRSQNAHLLFPAVIELLNDAKCLSLWSQKLIMVVSPVGTAWHWKSALIIANDLRPGCQFK